MIQTDTISWIYVRAHGRVTTRDMVRETSASPNTLKATFTSLVEKSLLVRHGGGRLVCITLIKEPQTLHQIIRGQVKRRSAL